MARRSGKLSKALTAAIESPYAGDVETNLQYLRAAMRWCVLNGYSPYASHGLLTQDGVLDDDDPEERELGIKLGLDMAARTDLRIVFEDFGISSGMQRGIAHAKSINQGIIYVRLGDQWEKWLKK